MRNCFLKRDRMKKLISQVLRQQFEKKNMTPEREFLDYRSSQKKTIRFFKNYSIYENAKDYI